MTTDKLTVTIDGQEHELFMSYGLLDRLTKIIGGSLDITTASLEPNTRNETLIACLTKKGRAGVLDKVDIDNLDIDPEDVVRIVNWATEHVIGFFLKATERTKEMGERIKDKLGSLTHLVDGSKDSASPNPSAGPSTPLEAA
jgi:hypothetical protein